MADTKTEDDEAKTERFNMFMSPSEMKAIDEWAWSNRIRSKSEAVRRLIQLGLRSQARVADVVRNADEAVTRCHDVFAVTIALDADALPSSEVAELFEDGLVGILISVLDTHQDVEALRHELKAIAEAAEPKQGQDEAEAERKRRTDAYQALIQTSGADRETAEQTFRERFSKGAE